MTPSMTTVYVVYLSLIGVTIMFHEVLHYLSAKLVGAEDIKFIVTKRGIGFYISSLQNKGEVLLVLLSPQMLTAMYLYFALVFTGVARVISLLLAFVNILASYYDFKEVYRIGRGYI